jgi:hypothetical protein
MASSFPALQVRYWVLATVLLAALAASGCTRSEDDAAKRFESVKSGMTMAEVEALLGPGQEVDYEQLPEHSRSIIFTKTDNVTYRKWARETGKTKATLYAAFKEGKMVAGPMVEKTGPMNLQVGG